MILVVIIPAMIIQNNNSHSIPMDHLVRIVIVTNPRPHLRVDHVIDRIVIVHILNNVDENESQVVVQHHHPVLVPLLPRQLHPIPVQHRDPIRNHHHRLHPDQVIHLVIVILEDERMILEANL